MSSDRPARRPPGWQAPGPAPAGPQGRPELEPAPDEDLSYLAGDWRIFQKKQGHRWSLDDLVTAWVATRDLDLSASLRALDLGCGEGGDAVWLAEHGWQVLAVDVSETALSRAAAEARVAKPTLYYYFGSKEGLARSLIATVHGHCAFALSGTFALLGETAPLELAIAYRTPSPLVDALRAGNVILAIKQWRVATNVTLAEAKRDVEELQRRLGL